jgi:trans-2,3-dihydro-3-hydroxyanthranilate isomerase
MTPMAVCLPKTLRFSTCDVFTQTPFSGNPLAIVEDADGLTTAQMQTIAREFNLSETIFVQSPDNPQHSAKVRIFFPTAELPFAGHPTIGCAIHLALKHAPEGPFETQITLEEQAGLVPVKVWRDQSNLQAEFIAPVIPHAPVDGSAAPSETLAQALDIEMENIGFSTHKPAVWQGGPRFLYVPVGSLEALNRARPIEPYWSRVMDIGAVDSAYLYTPFENGYRARMFSPTAGIPEDPATGSASAILAAQLLESGALGDKDTRIDLQQGVEMGRPSRIGLSCVVSDQTLTQVRISGSAIAISSGQITLPKP